MRILFIGCVESSYVFLKSLLENGEEVVGVITKQSSDFNSDFVDITPLCDEYRIPYLYVKNVNETESVEFIKKLNPDIGYCLGWSQLVKGEVIDLFPKGMIGYHPAALPNNRGRHPIIWALALGLDKTASSFFMIEKMADTGDIISQMDVEISYEDDARSLMDKLLDEGARQIVTLTRELKSGTIKRIPQEISGGNSWRKRGRQDGQIDWRMSSRAIYNLVRALTKPYVGAHFMLNDKEIKVWRVAEVIDVEQKYTNIEPGKVIEVEKKTITVKTGDNLVQLINYDEADIQPGNYL